MYIYDKTTFVALQIHDSASGQIYNICGQWQGCWKVGVQTYILNHILTIPIFEGVYLLILELSVLNPGTEVGKKIGTPVSYTEEDAAQSNKASSSNNGTVPKPTATSNAKKAEPHPSPYNNNNKISLNQSLTMGHIHPISSLSPNQNKWVIKARVTAKDPMHTFRNAKGEGISFSVNLIDESGEIRATAFRAQAKKFYGIIEVGRVYYISKCQLKPANKQFNTLKHDYEMTLTGLTEIKPCEEDDNDIPEIKYDLVPISKLANLEPNTTVDTIGICKEVGELHTFPSGKKRRELTLVDSSNAAVILKLWDDDAVNFDVHAQQQVILVKGARVTEFNGDKEINKRNSSVMKINPDIPEGNKLRGWFDNGGGEHISNMISNRTGGAGGGFSTDI
ncbi:replication protein A 70 kDa DNA-binding subunit-like [Zeugodacus cucurbitae]|uniref:replication protein A 70 kDa DNA-binding subunit-like n=1 Tax=Zeugodacus cucurbitae TaxID=28588 RepID=UPI0023D907F6|nr:replication protein A 70 kDa DNA-binding subunit-like [Zeugodacus cucurbitae]